MIDEFGGDFFQWLRGFYYVARTGSVSAAAVLMGRQQPTITHQIRSLETTLDVKLFEYSKQKMNLTSEGHLLLDYTIKIFDTLKELSDTFDKTRHQHLGTISIGSTHALITYYLAAFISDFKRQVPQADFNLKGGMQETIEDEVYYGSCDFGVLHLNSVKRTFAHHDLFETSLSLISRRSNPFHITEKLTLEDISKMPFIYYPINTTIKELVDNAFETQGLTIQKELVVNDYEGIKQFVRFGTGISIVFDYAITDYDRSRLMVISLEKYFGKVKVGIIMRKKKYLSSGVRSFLVTLRPDLRL